jgi:hypothetical protein
MRAIQPFRDHTSSRFMYSPLFPLRFLEVQGLGESKLGNDARAAAQLNDIEVQFDKQPDENRFIRSDQAS